MNGEFIPPQTIIGDYRVISHFASGGMGDVYEVVNPFLREFFAMKVLRDMPVAHESARDEAINRFFEEARTTARLRHSNIVTLHTMGIEPTQGRLYVVMDYVGLSPKRRLEVLETGPWFSRTTLQGADGGVGRVPLSLEEVFQAQGPIAENILRILAADIAQALHFAHTSGDAVIHCDIKPANILIREDGHAVVTDFGIAKAQRMATEEASGVILGTPDYMAPEQRVPDGTLTPATDIYAFGVMICRLLTGRFPVGIWKRPSELGLNPAWDILIDRCIRRNPEDRWQSMAEVYAYLRRLPQLAKRIHRAKVVRKVLWGSVLGIVLVGGLSTAAFLLSTIHFDTTKDAKDWIEVKPEPAAFLQHDYRMAQPNPEWADVLVYDASAPSTLPLPKSVLPHIATLALPSTTTEIPEGFVRQFPRLEYVACHSENPTFFAHEGILYTRAKPHRPVLVPPRLFGNVALPTEVDATFPHPWRNAMTTDTTLRTTATGAYDQPLAITASQPITWQYTP